MTIQGANLAGNPTLVAPFGFTVKPPAAPSTDAASWKLNLDVAAGTPIGVYPIRVKTDDGLSNPFLFSVGQLPQVAEKEENNAFESAQAIPSPVVVEGQAAGIDVDYFRFAGKKGERIVVDAQCARIGSGVDPSIRLTTAGRTFVASADDSPGLLTDARLTATLPEDTDYVIELSDSRYQGGGRPVYRLVVGAVPVAEEVFPLGGRQGETVGFELRGGNLPDLKVAAATVNATPDRDVFALRATNQAPGMDTPAGPLLDVESLPPIVVSHRPELREPADPNAPPVRAAVPVTLNGRLDPTGDEDRYVLAVTPGQKLRIEVDAAERGSALDGVLQVLGAKDAVLATADDTNTPIAGKTPKAVIISPDPTLDFTVPAGLTEVTLALKDLQGRGGTGYAYRITVEPVVPSFEITLNDLQVGIPRNGTAAVGVTVARKGYNGPISLSVANPPAGVTVRPGTIADGQAVGAFTVSASPDAAFDAVTLQVVGSGQGPDGPIVRSATKEVVFAQQATPMATLPTNTSTQIGLAVAPALPTAVKLDSPATPIEVVHGFGAPIEVKAERSAGADAALAVTPLALPPGLAVPAVNIAEKAADGVRHRHRRPRGPPRPDDDRADGQGEDRQRRAGVRRPRRDPERRTARRDHPGRPRRRGQGRRDGRGEGEGRAQGSLRGAGDGQGDGAPRRLEGRAGDRGPDGVGFHAQDRRRPQGGRGIGGRRRRAGLPDQQERLCHSPRRARGQGLAGGLTAGARCRAIRPARP